MKGLRKMKLKVMNNCFFDRYIEGNMYFLLYRLDKNMHLPHKNKTTKKLVKIRPKIATRPANSNISEKIHT